MKRIIASLLVAAMVLGASNSFALKKILVPNMDTINYPVGAVIELEFQVINADGTASKPDYSALRSSHPDSVKVSGNKVFLLKKGSGTLVFSYNGLSTSIPFSTEEASASLVNEFGNDLRIKISKSGSEYTGYCWLQGYTKNKGLVKCTKTGMLKVAGLPTGEYTLNLLEAERVGTKLAYKATRLMKVYVDGDKGYFMPTTGIEYKDYTITLK